MADKAGDKMRSWFPLTDYDFYAYLTAGMIVVAAYDYGFADATLIRHQDWTVVEMVFWAAIAYLTGQIIAQLSSPILEHLIGRGFFQAPSVVLLGFRPPRIREKTLGTLLGIREYRPLPTTVAQIIRGKAKTALGGIDPTTGEEVFVVAFPYARGVTDSATRLDSFLNQYGMCRNVSFAALVSLPPLLNAALHSCTPRDAWLVGGALVLSIGMFVRFMKFYAAFASEVLRAFAKVGP